MIYLDSETVGLHGMPVILQHAKDDGPVEIHDIWTVPIYQTVQLIEDICAEEVCGFNLAFDWFHICKLYTTFTSMPDWDATPEDIIDEIAIAEERARFVDVCLRPKSALDLMLVARRTQYQSLMARDPIKVRRVPSIMAPALVRELEERIKIDDIYFAKSKDKRGPRWKIMDIKDSEGNLNKGFKDVVLRFKASGALKTLAEHALKVKSEDILLYKDIDVPSRLYPTEYGYAPFALAVCPDFPKTKVWYRFDEKKKKRIRAWPAVIKEFILHWGYNQRARKYASDDVIYTRDLRKFFGNPDPGDMDSELAVMVAAVRWRGYAINKEALQEQRRIAFTQRTKVPQAPHVVRRYLEEVLDPIERLCLGKGTKKVVLEELSMGSDWEDHPVRERARAVLEARKATKKIELIDKLLRAGRLHPDYKVTGTLTNRMAGAGGVNVTGIDHSTDIRACFPFLDQDTVFSNGTTEVDTFTFCGGDFEAFEVAIAVTVFNDPGLNEALQSGKKIHALFAMELFPGMTYEEIEASKGSKVKDYYDAGKKGIFAYFYGGDANTHKNRLGIPLEIAEAAVRGLERKYPGIGRFGQEVQRRFGALSQPGGIGSKVIWRNPDDYVESFLGFRRYFSLENRICAALYDLANKPPEPWKNLRVKVTRSDRIQTAGGAVQSALFGSAFRISSSTVRQAKNHYIQSPGAEITKRTQLGVWSFQPVGVHPWQVVPMNVHDEINTLIRKGLEQPIREKVAETVAIFRPKIPMISMEWRENLTHWAEKNAKGWKWKFIL